MVNEEDITIYLPFIRKIAGKYARYLEMDDLVQTGYLGLLKAKETFDPEKNIKFITYASHYISGYIKNYVKKEQYHNLAGDKDSTDQPNKVDLELLVINESFKENIVRFFRNNNINDRDIDIFICRQLVEKKLTLKEIGNKYGISKQWAAQIEKRLLGKLKQNLDKVIL